VFIPKNLLSLKVGSRSLIQNNYFDQNSVLKARTVFNLPSVVLLQLRSGAQEKK